MISQTGRGCHSYPKTVKMKSVTEESKNVYRRERVQPDRQTTQREQLQKGDVA